MFVSPSLLIQSECWMTNGQPFLKGGTTQHGQHSTIEQPDGPAHDKPSPNGSDSMVSEIPWHKDLIASCKWYVRTPESWELNCHQERD